jgi:putative endonuclease
MAHHNDIGQQGEQAAKRYLEDLGYHTLEQNWRFQRAEVDLIMLHNQTVIFVEVKTRAGNNPLHEPVINPKKIRFLQEAAAVYGDQHGYSGELRFDFVAVRIGKNRQPAVVHYPDAFFSYL